MGLAGFPKINQTQVVLLRANCFTGHVLDSNYVNWQSRQKDEEMYSVFNSLDEVTDYIDLQKCNYPNADYHVYNHAQEQIYEYYPEEPSDLPEHNLDTKFSVWQCEKDISEDLYATFNTLDEAVGYVELQRLNYPNSEFQLRDYSRNILCTYKKKSKRFFNLFYHLQFFIKYSILNK